MSIYVPARSEAKAFLGPGAAAMTTQPMLAAVAQTPHKLMKAAAGYVWSDPWIRAAEKTITGEFSTVPWHLEDEDDQEIDDLYPDQRYTAPWKLLEQPQANLAPEDRQVNASTRRELWSVTSRHMGACGSAFWYLDQLEPVARTPLAILYIAPWRMWPSFTKSGNLTGWVLDYEERTGTGTPLALEQVVQFNLEPPNEGAFAPGLVQSAMGLINLDNMTIGHASNVLTAGGRLAGIVSPKTADASLPDDKFQQLVRDFRTINELPDAARRTNILQGPVDFNRTAATLTELELIPLMSAVRDDLLALWGVPFSQLGGSVGTGLNSGDVRKYDRAALWQYAIHQRLVPFSEKIQFDLLDRYKTLGITVELEIEEPEFEDDGPRYELLAKSAATPMRNVERRALIGLEPFGDPILDNAIWLPNTMVQIATAPDEDGNPVSSAVLGDPLGSQPVDQAAVVTVSKPAQLAIPATVAKAESIEARLDFLAGNHAKASLPPKVARLHATLTAIRKRVDREQTPALKAALGSFLAAQRQDIASRLRLNAVHIAAKYATSHGKMDTDAWFAKARWDRELTGILERPLTTMAQTVSEHIKGTIPVKAMPVSAVDRVLARGAARVTGINETTRDAIVKAIADALAAGATAYEDGAATIMGVADALEGLAIFDDYRAELIARTEVMDAYNATALGTYSDAGVNEVQAIDGDGDEECAARDGQTFSIEEADAIEDHPNGTLDWVPVIEDLPVPEAKATRVEYDAQGRVTRIVDE